MKTIFLVLLFGSLSFVPSAHSNNVVESKLSSVQLFIPGSANRDKVEKTLGKPTHIFNSSPSVETWEYSVGKIVRLSISFESQGLVSGWTWLVVSGEPEQDLKIALGKYPNANWTPETVKWVNPHQVPMECFYKDYKEGISIAYSRARKEVTSISRWNPSRNLTSSQDEKPPKFCIDSACTDGILAKDFFKDGLPCKVP